MAFIFPKLYPILDSAILPATDRTEFLAHLGASLTDAGVTLLEYRNKAGSDAEILADCAALRAAMPSGQVRLILDDRANLVATTGFDGVHVDAGDITPTEARALIGPDRILGTFGGSNALLPGILNAPADYLAIGPIFPTVTKHTTQPPIGIEGVRKLRAEAGPNVVLSAAAGITLDTAPAVLAAGASMVAVSAAIFRRADPAAEVRRWLVQLQ
ncbi:MAG: thiamine phosphate synthase [Terracidiphilus sp.]